MVSSAVMFSPAQISGSRRKVSSGRMQRISSSAGKKKKSRLSPLPARNRFSEPSQQYKA